MCEISKCSTRNCAVYRRGQAMITAVIFLLIGSLILITGVARPVLQNIQSARVAEESRQSFFASESGVEDVLYRVIHLLDFSSPEVLAFTGAIATTTITTNFDTYEIVAAGDYRELLRTTKAVLSFGAGASFNYGLQADAGGVHLKNTATIQGNVYSNGPVTGINAGVVNGDVVSAGPSGLIDGLHATGTAYAHTISNSIIDGDAYYQILSGTSVDGTEYPGSSDQPTTTLPISDELIEEWKASAEGGGVLSEPCPYVINDGAVILGPVKIACDLDISGDPTITLGGPVWIEGNIIVSNTAQIRVSSSQTGKSIPVIADDPLNPEASGAITIQNSALFIGSGDNSYVLMVSQNNSAENGGSETAINVQNSVSGDFLIYAAHGKIDIQNNIELKEVTGYRIEAQNFAEIIYDTGLASLLFTSGPSGGFVIQEWEEIE